MTQQILSACGDCQRQPLSHYRQRHQQHYQGSYYYHHLKNHVNTFLSHRRDLKEKRALLLKRQNMNIQLILYHEATNELYEEWPGNMSTLASVGSLHSPPDRFLDAYMKRQVTQESMENT